MTTMRSLNVQCTHCEKTFEITWTPSVNTWLNPDIIERIVEDDYYFVCPHCKERHFLSAQMLISCPKGMFILDLGEDYETKIDKLHEYEVIDVNRKVIKTPSKVKPQKKHDPEIAEMVEKIEEITKDFRDKVLKKRNEEMEN
ncbi:MAG: CpXC domain-containing protein [Candidatus Heimdallarchaeota archaeon]